MNPPEAVVADIHRVLPGVLEGLEPHHRLPCCRGSRNGSRIATSGWPARVITTTSTTTRRRDCGGSSLPTTSGTTRCLCSPTRGIRRRRHRARLGEPTLPGALAALLPPCRPMSGWLRAPAHPKAWTLAGGLRAAFAGPREPSDRTPLRPRVESQEPPAVAVPRTQIAPSGPCSTSRSVPHRPLVTLGRALVPSRSTRMNWPDRAPRKASPRHCGKAVPLADHARQVRWRDSTQTAGAGTHRRPHGRGCPDRCSATHWTPAASRSSLLRSMRLTSSPPTGPISSGTAAPGRRRRSPVGFDVRGTRSAMLTPPRAAYGLSGAPRRRGEGGRLSRACW